MQVLIGLNVEGHLLLGLMELRDLKISLCVNLRRAHEALFGLIVVLRGNIVKELLDPRGVLDLVFYKGLLRSQCHEHLLVLSGQLQASSGLLPLLRVDLLQHL